MNLPPLPEPMSTWRRLYLYALAYVSSPPMIVGFLAGLLWHRVCDGWKVSRQSLDKLDDTLIDDIVQRTRKQP